MKLTKRLTALLLTTALTLGLAACGGKKDPGPAESNSPEGPAPAASSTYRQLYSSEVETMNYLTTTTFENLRIPANVVDTLIEYDSYGVVQPSLAESWETNADASEWTFKIRQGIQWVNQAGEPMAECTAWDWATGLEWILNYHKNQSKNTAMHFEVTKGAAEYYEYTKNLDAEAGKATTAKDAKFLEMVGIEIPDDYTVIYKLSKSVPYFESLCTGACI